MEKICFFMATPFTLGGEQRVVSVVSNLLLDKGYDVTILCTDNFTPIDYSIYKLNSNINIKFVNEYNAEKIVKIRNRRNKMYIDNLSTGKYKNSLLVQKYINCDRRTAKIISRIINKEKYDYVISLSTIYNTMLAVISDKISAKTIGWQHSCSERYFDLPNERHYNQDKFSKYMFKKLDSYVVLTNHDKNYLKKRFGVDTVVINNPKSLISNKVSSLKNKKFLAVGRYVPVKNFEMLIDIFYEFHKKNKEWSLDIVGEGELRDVLDRKIKNYKLEKFVKLKKHTNNIEKYYLNSSVYLMSSLYEGWGMVMGEAIEFGLPIVSFNIASAPEMIHDGYNGYIIENYDKENYINCMLKLAKNNKLLKTMGKNARKISDKKPNEMIAEEWINLFKSIK